MLIAPENYIPYYSTHCPMQSDDRDEGLELQLPAAGFERLSLYICAWLLHSRHVGQRRSAVCNIITWLVGTYHQGSHNRT
jgi:hypothetical protein